MNQPRMTLDVIDVNRPCPASWESMEGDERSRFCTGCGLHVHNLSAMTLDEAQRLVCERAGRVCVRFERDAHGKVVTLDYRPRTSRVRRGTFWGAIGTAAALIAAAVLRFVVTTAPQPQPRNLVVMGDFAMPPVVNPPPPVAQPQP